MHRAAAVGWSLAHELEQEHLRLTSQLEACHGPLGVTHPEAFEAFRRALVRHIAIEEKVLAPALRARLGAAVDGALKDLKQDHMALVTLVVPEPCDEWFEDLREFLVHHFAVEEAEGGLHALALAHLADAQAELAEAVRLLPAVRLDPPCAGAEVEAALHTAFVQAGLAPEGPATKRAGGDPLE